MYLKKNFAPVSITSSNAPRIFAYENKQDYLKDMKEPGYFNEAKLMLSPDSRIEIISLDYHATIFVKGVVNNQVCIYEDDIRCMRGDALLPNQIKPKAAKKKKVAA